MLSVLRQGLCEGLIVFGVSVVARTRPAGLFQRVHPLPSSCQVRSMAGGGSANPAPAAGPGSDPCSLLARLSRPPVSRAALLTSAVRIPR